MHTQTSDTTHTSAEHQGLAVRPPNAQSSSLAMVKEDIRKTLPVKTVTPSKATKASIADYELIRNKIAEEAKLSTNVKAKSTESKNSIKVTKLFIAEELVFVAICGGYGYGQFLKGAQPGCAETPMEKCIPPKLYTWIGAKNNSDIGPPSYKDSLR